MTLFDACQAAQRRSPDIVIYSPSVGEYVNIAWPCSAGRRIGPHRIKDWLRRRGLHWPCFCPLLTTESRSSRIVENLGGTTSAVCFHMPSHCGFYLNLNELYLSATQTSNYSHIPLFSTGEAPDLASLALTYELSTSTSQHGSFFSGYCGEHKRDYPQTMQLSGSSSSERRVMPDRPRPLYHPYQSRPQFERRLPDPFPSSSVSPSTPTRVFNRRIPFSPSSASSSTTRPQFEQRLLDVFPSSPASSSTPQASSRLSDQETEERFWAAGRANEAPFERCDSCARYIPSSTWWSHVRRCN